MFGDWNLEETAVASPRRRRSQAEAPYTIRHEGGGEEKDKADDSEPNPYDKDEPAAYPYGDTSVSSRTRGGLRREAEEAAGAAAGQAGREMSTAVSFVQSGRPTDWDGMCRRVRSPSAAKDFWTAQATSLCLELFDFIKSLAVAKGFQWRHATSSSMTYPSNDIHAVSCRLPDFEWRIVRASEGLDRELFAARVRYRGQEASDSARPFTAPPAGSDAFRVAALVWPRARGTFGVSMKP